MNITARPTWQWLGKNTSANSPRTRTANIGISPLKQALLPRSFDLNLDFSLKYRR
jgi:hypothetical protein